MNHSYPATWYRDTADSIVEYPALTQSLSTEVCVIGAGLAGLTTSLELLRLGKSVSLLESKRLAWGASGRNAGFVAPGFAESLENIIARCGLAQAQRLYQYSKLGVNYVHDTIEVLNPDIKLGDGTIEVCRFNDPAINAAEISEFNATFLESQRFWTEEKTGSILNTSRYRCAVFDDAGFHIHPLNYAQALASQIQKLAGSIFENTQANCIRRKAGGFVISTPNAEIEAQQIVLCTSAYDFQLFPPLSRALLPVATHIVVTEPLSEAINPVQTQAAIADTRRAGDYYRLLGDRRLQWGGKITTSQRPPKNLDSIMGKSMRSVYPQLGDVGIDYRWSGLMAYCLHKMPLIGEIQPGIWSATGFGGQGLNTTAMAGILISSAIANDDQRWRDFTPYSARWAGGVAGRAGVQLSYWAMQMRDWLDEIRGCS